MIAVSVAEWPSSGMGGLNSVSLTDNGPIYSEPYGSQHNKTCLGVVCQFLKARLKTVSSATETTWKIEISLVASLLTLPGSNKYFS